MEGFLYLVRLLLGLGIPLHRPHPYCYIGEDSSILGTWTCWWGLHRTTLNIYVIFCVDLVQSWTISGGGTFSPHFVWGRIYSVLTQWSDSQNLNNTTCVYIYICMLDLPKMLGNSFKEILRTGGWFHGDFHPMGSVKHHQAKAHTSYVYHLG